MPALVILHFQSTVLSMLAFTGKYGTSCLYLNCVHSLESFLYLKLYSAMILVNAGMGNKYSTFRARYCTCWHLLVNKGLMVDISIPIHIPININCAKVSVQLYTGFGKFLVSEMKYFS